MTLGFHASGLHREKDALIARLRAELVSSKSREWPEAHDRLRAERIEIDNLYAAIIVKRNVLRRERDTAMSKLEEARKALREGMELIDDFRKGMVFGGDSTWPRADAFMLKGRGILGGIPHDLTEKQKEDRRQFNKEIGV